MRSQLQLFVILILSLATVSVAGAAGNGFQPRQVADMLFELAFANRKAYTRDIVQRLAVEHSVIAATEHYEEAKGLPLPAQMFRSAAEELLENTDDYWMALRSLDPINFANGPISSVEESGLQYVLDNPAERFYAEEKWSGRQTFVAVYPDVASVNACVGCHNNHPQSPRQDYKLDDVMGGIVIRLFLEE